MFSRLGVLCFSWGLLVVFGIYWFDLVRIRKVQKKHKGGNPYPSCPWHVERRPVDFPCRGGRSVREKGLISIGSRRKGGTVFPKPPLALQSERRKDFLTPLIFREEGWDTWNPWSPSIKTNNATKKS